MRRRWIVMVLLVTLAGVSGPAAGNAQTFRGSYQWNDGGNGDLSAELKPAGDGEWKVKFRFSFGRKKNSWKGTASGSLEDGSTLEGTATWSGRKWIWTATIEDGVMRGKHTEIQRGGTEYPTGTFELAR